MKRRRQRCSPSPRGVRIFFFFFLARSHMHASTHTHVVSLRDPSLTPPIREEKKREGGHSFMQTNILPKCRLLSYTLLIPEKGKRQIQCRTKPLTYFFYWVPSHCSLLHWFFLSSSISASRTDRTERREERRKGTFGPPIDRRAGGEKEGKEGRG